MTRALHIAAALGLALLVGCATTDGSETSTQAQPSAVDCQTAHEACKTNCRKPENLPSQGPCFNQCLKKLHTCEGR